MVSIYLRVRCVSYTYIISAMQSGVPYLKSVTRVLCFVLLCLSSTYLTSAQPPSFTPKLSTSVFIDYNINGFWEYLPRNYVTDVNNKYPLLIYFHGLGDSGGTPDQNTLNQVLAAGPARLIYKGGFPDSFYVANRWHKFIVLAPQIKNGFDGNSSKVEISSVNALIDYAKKSYRVDESRIYMCGLSMGGGITWDYAGSSVEASKRLAAVAIAAGASDLTAEEARNIASANLPIVATHNTVDNVISTERTRDNLEKINALPIKPTPVAVYFNTPGKSVNGGNDNHNVWSRTFEDIRPQSTEGGNFRDTMGFTVYEWMLQNTRSTEGSLPVVWQNFSLQEVNNVVLVQWSTSQEVNVSKFIVERSNDGFTWAPIAELQPNRGNDSLKQYRYSDISPLPATSYYRIRQVDADGKFTYSTIEKLNRARDFQGQVKVYPNPFVDRIAIDFDKPLHASAIIISLASPAGVIQRSEVHPVQPGRSNLFAIQGLHILSKGVYYLTVITEDGKILRKEKLIKQ